MRRFLSVLAALAFGLLLTIALDRVAGLLLLRRPVASRSAGPSAQGILFPPGAVMRHTTSEFDYLVHVNRLGFRGPDFPVASADTFRIAVIGDSFVYGWGVNDGESWPSVLQSDLRAQGRAVAVANLGIPGAQPRQYADIAERAVPVLRPQLVIVGILSGQDYGQEWWSTQSPRERWETASGRELPSLLWVKVGRPRLLALASHLYPTSTAILTRPGALAAARSGPQEQGDTVSAAATRNALAAQARQVMQEFGPRERARFARLDTATKRLFFSGDINPATIYYAVRRPEYFQWTEQYATPRGQVVEGAITDAIRRIRAVTGRYGGRVVVVSEPYWPYVDANGCAALARLGYNCDRGMYEQAAADSAVTLASERAEVPAFAFTSEVRAAAAHEPLYYPLDLHFNRAGYHLFGDLVARTVLPLLPPRA